MGVPGFLSSLSIWIILSIQLQGCANNVISIDAHDSVTFTTLETSIPTNEQRGDRIKLRFARANGDFRQSVPDGKMIIINEAQIHGPTEVSGAMDLEYASISYGSEQIPLATGKSAAELNLVIYLGLAQTRMDMTLAHVDSRFDVADTTTEIFLQAGIGASLAPAVRGGLIWAFSLGNDLSGISEIDLRLSYRPINHLEMIGGYRWLEYNYLVDEEDSTIRARFRGPFMGLNIPF